jgi:hypothetical protein
MHSLTNGASGGWPEDTRKRINHRHCFLESRMRENRLYGSEGGGALTRSPYPYRSERPFGFPTPRGSRGIRAERGR